MNVEETHSAADRQAAALDWIVSTIEAHGLPYQIVGGLAAMAHGGARPLNDIDLYMPLSAGGAGFLQDIQDFTVWGPEAVVDGPWDITYMKLLYYGQKIEIGESTNPRIQQAATGAWVDQHIDFDSSVTREVLGRRVRVMPLDQLVAYKRMLGRDVDLQDIRELTAGI